jgi:dTDP-4-dehydrorhamnose 3,5-epimerase
MSFSSLKIDGSWVFTPKKFPDERGSFHEVFKLSVLTETLGFGFEVKQVNQSVSRAGVIRGIHWADVPPGQAKYVYCAKGSIWDVVVDIRVGSPTFGQFDAALLSEENGKSLLIKEGLGHVFLSLEDNTVVNLHFEAKKNLSNNPASAPSMMPQSAPGVVSQQANIPLDVQPLTPMYTGKPTEPPTAENKNNKMLLLGAGVLAAAGIVYAMTRKKSKK